MVVENGTGMPDADSYISVADAEAYLVARGKELTGNAAAKEAALIQATDYMVRYAWKGSRVSGTQALDWPRVGVEANGFPIPSNIVPVPVRHACAELAVRAQAGDLAPDLGRRTSQETVGPVSVSYEPGSVPYTVFRAVDNMLAAYVDASGTKLVRA